MNKLFMVLRIVIACLIWGVIYEYAIPFINALVYSLPIIGNSRMAEGIMTTICFIIACFDSLILRASLEKYILLALGILYLAMLGILIPLANGLEPYINWQFGDIVFGSVIGWYVSAYMTKEEKNADS